MPDVPLASLIYAPPSIVAPLALAEMFPRPQPLAVELGSGDGSFLVQYASLHPENNFIGVERLLGRLRKIDRKGRRLGLTNLRVVRVEAAYFLEYLLPPECAAALHVYFPDPWPKRRHHKNRLINERFPELARRVLTPGGIVFLRTDDANYFAQMNRVFQARTDFRAVETPAELSVVTTDFERDFNVRGVPTLRAAYQRS
ncbi:MAG: tRNA (guanosine(46)-N7)-methyltransferase TrmB [Verrucomicrobia bacterium]|nr:tRNA (guanosine(46)-N7)-methyltransferase TrmB [Verrucomicrobiota bacterium]